MTEAKARVVITDFISDSLDIEREILQGVATVEAFDAYHENELHGRIESADAIMLYHNLALSAETIQRLESCKLIVRCGVGFDNVDHGHAGQRVPVANVPDYGTEEADSAIGMALSMTRESICSTSNALQRTVDVPCVCPCTVKEAVFSVSSAWGGSVQQLLVVHWPWEWMSGFLIRSSQMDTTKLLE